MNELEPVYRGDDFCLRVEIEPDVKGKAINITGWKFISTLKLSSELPDLPEMDINNNRVVLQITTTAPANELSKVGKFDLLYPHQKTVDLIPTRYEIDIQSQTTRNMICTLFKGVIQILPDVTHRGLINGQ